MKLKRFSILFLSSLWLSACASYGSYIWVDSVSLVQNTDKSYYIAVADQLNIAVWNQEKLSAQVLVRPDGCVSMPLLGDVEVAGLSPSEAAGHFAVLLRDLVNNPKVTVTVLNIKEPTVSVLGEVRTAGAYPLRTNDGVLQLLAKAGGLTQFAHDDAIFVSRKELEGKRVRFRLDDLTRGRGRGAQFQLRDGDVLVAE
jgi:polysaccharide biosynthesis/export protein